LLQDCPQLLGLHKIKTILLFIYKDILFTLS